MTNNKFNKLFGQKPRDPKKKNNSISYGYCSFYSKSTEEIMIKLAKIIRKNMALKIYV